MRIKRESDTLARHRQAGDTLAEVVVGMCVLAIAYVVAYSGFLTGFQEISADRQISRAGQILVEKSEMVRLYNWAQVTGGDTNTYIPATFTSPFYPNANNGGLTYYGTVTITNAPITESYASDMREVIISLTWTSNIPHTRTITTSVSRYGLQTYLF